MPRKPPPNMTRAEYLQMHRERRELIVAEVRAGKRHREVAEQFGVSCARVTQIANAAGIFRRQRKRKA